MIDWKEPNKEVMRLIQDSFFNASRTGFDDVSKGEPGIDHPDPDINYVYATEEEIARGIGRDYDSLTEEEKRWGALSEDWETSCPEPDLIRHVLRDEIKGNYLLHNLADGTPILVIDEQVREFTEENAPNPEA